MTEYRVQIETDVTADSPEEAAAQAWENLTGRPIRIYLARIDCDFCAFGPAAEEEEMGDAKETQTEPC